MPRSWDDLARLYNEAFDRTRWDAFWGFDAAKEYSLDIDEIRTLDDVKFIIGLLGLKVDNGLYNSLEPRWRRLFK